MKIKIFRDFELDISGVTPVWTWQCPSTECRDQTTQEGHALFWENAVRSANHHSLWHSARKAPN